MLRLKWLQRLDNCYRFKFSTKSSNWFCITDEKKRVLLTDGIELREVYIPNLNSIKDVIVNDNDVIIFGTGKYPMVYVWDLKKNSLRAQMNTIEQFVHHTEVVSISENEFIIAYPDLAEKQFYYLNLLTKKCYNILNVESCDLPGMHMHYCDSINTLFYSIYMEGRTFINTFNLQTKKNKRLEIDVDHYGTCLYSPKTNLLYVSGHKTVFVYDLVRAQITHKIILNNSCSGLVPLKYYNSGWLFLKDQNNVYVYNENSGAIFNLTNFKNAYIRASQIVNDRFLVLFDHNTRTLCVYEFMYV